MSSLHSEMREHATSEEAAIRQWLQRFAAAVRERDYEGGKTLFAPDVLGFGTYADRRDGLDLLVAGQWQNIWGVTRGFDFDLDEMRCRISGDVAWVAVTWHSQKQRESGDWQSRPGRATFAFEKRAGKWLAVHSHFSLCPSYLRLPETHEYSH
jgi:ketosteroid isomerase-like protein